VFRNTTNKKSRIKEGLFEKAEHALEAVGLKFETETKHNMVNPIVSLFKFGSGIVANIFSFVEDYTGASTSASMETERRIWNLLWIVAACVSIAAAFYYLSVTVFSLMLIVITLGLEMFLWNEGFRWNSKRRNLPDQTSWVSLGETTWRITQS